MIRRLTSGEIALARSVFGDAIDYPRVRLMTRPAGAFAVVFGSLITFPPGHPPGDFAAAEPRLQSWLIHELTHVWQFQTRPLWTVCSWAKTLLSGGYGPGLPGYRYELSVGGRGDLDLEQEAAMIEHAFMLRENGTCIAAPTGATLAVYRSHLPSEFRSRFERCLRRT